MLGVGCCWLCRVLRRRMLPSSWADFPWSFISTVGIVSVPKESALENVAKGFPKTYGSVATPSWAPSWLSSNGVWRTAAPEVCDIRCRIIARLSTFLEIGSWGEEYLLKFRRSSYALVVWHCSGVSSVRGRGIIAAAFSRSIKSAVGSIGRFRRNSY